MRELLAKSKQRANGISDEAIKNALLELIKVLDKKVDEYYLDADDDLFTLEELKIQLAEIQSQIESTQKIINEIVLTDAKDARSKRNANAILKSLLIEGVEKLRINLKEINPSADKLPAKTNDAHMRASAVATPVPYASVVGNVAGRDMNVSVVTQHIPLNPPTEAEIRQPLHLWQVPMLSQNFTGRTELLAQLETKLTQSKRPVAITALHGLGGIGKTQLVLKDVYDNHHQYQNVFWLSAETEDQLLLNYRNLAVEV